MKISLCNILLINRFTKLINSTYSSCFFYDVILNSLAILVTGFQVIKIINNEHILLILKVQQREEYGKS